MRKAVFLDRDGTLNADLDFVHKKEDWQWLPGVVDGLARLRAAGLVLVVVSNQSGIARGMFDADTVEALHRWVNARLATHKADIDAFYYCPHLPAITGPCTCRKPQPGLLLQAAREMDIDLASSWMVGDRVRDAQAGLAAGCRAIVIGTSRGEQLPSEAISCRDFAAACEHILGAASKR